MNRYHSNRQDSFIFVAIFFVIICAATAQSLGADLMPVIWSVTGSIAFLIVSGVLLRNDIPTKMKRILLPFTIPLIFMVWIKTFINVASNAHREHDNLLEWGEWGLNGTQEEPGIFSKFLEPSIWTESWPYTVITIVLCIGASIIAKKWSEAW